MKKMFLLLLMSLCTIPMLSGMDPREYLDGDLIPSANNVNDSLQDGNDQEINYFDQLPPETIQHIILQKIEKPNTPKQLIEAYGVWKALAQMDKRTNEILRDDFLTKKLKEKIKQFSQPSKKWLLFCAAEKDYVKIVKCLVEHGANVNQPNEDGWTPLHFAANFGHIDIVKSLVKHGANVNQQKKIGSSFRWEASVGSGWTPLCNAAEKDHIDIVEYLLVKCNANVTLTTYDGQTALDIARERGCTDIVELLEKNMQVDND